MKVFFLTAITFLSFANNVYAYDREKLLTCSKYIQLIQEKNMPAVVEMIKNENICCTF